MTEKYNFDDYKKDELTRPRDKAWSNWAKFEKVGDMCQGYIRDVFYKAAEGQYDEQRGITLENPKGELVNVAIKYIPFVLAKTDHLRIGDPLTVILEEERPNKGLSATKIFGYYGKNLDESSTEPTVRELTEKDRVEQLGTNTELDKEFNGEPVEATTAETEDVPFPSPSDKKE